MYISMWGIFVTGCFMLWLMWAALHNEKIARELAKELSKKREE